MQGDSTNSFITERVEAMLRSGVVSQQLYREGRGRGLNIFSTMSSLTGLVLPVASESKDHVPFSQDDCLAYIGNKFKVMLGVPDRSV